MATPIQRYQSKVSMTGETPNVKVSPELFSASGKLISDIGGALGTVAEHFVDAQETQQKIAAANNAKLLMSDVLARAQQDPDPNNTLGYAKEFEGIQKQASQGITLRNARIGFDNEFSTQLNDGLIKLNTFQREKVVDLGTAAIYESLKNDTTDYLHATDNVSEFAALARMKSRIGEGRAKGIIHATVAQKMEEKLLSEIGSDKVSYDLQRAQTPEQVEAIKQKFLSGGYTLQGVKIDEKKSLDIINSFDAYKKKKGKEATDRQATVYNQNEMDVIKKYLNGGAITTIDADVDPNFKRVFMDSLKIKGDDKPAVAVSLTKKFLDINLGENASDPSKQINAMRDYRNEVIANRADLNDGNYKRLLSYSDPQYVQSNKEKFSFLQAAISFIASGSPVRPYLQMVNKIMESASQPGVTPEMVPGIARKLRSDQAVSDNPEMMGKENPTNYIYSQGNVNVVYPGESVEKVYGRAEEDMVRVIQKSDGQHGTIPRRKFNAEKYALE